MAGNGKRVTKEEKAQLLSVIMPLHAMRISDREIGMRLGLHHQTVSSWIVQHYEKLALPSTEAARKQDLDLIDHAISTLQPKVDTGDVQAHAALVRWVERRAKMLGLDQPTEVNATVTHQTALDSSISSLLDQMEEKDKTTAL